MVVLFRISTPVPFALSGNFAAFRPVDCTLPCTRTVWLECTLSIEVRHIKKAARQGTERLFDWFDPILQHIQRLQRFHGKLAACHAFVTLVSSNCVHRFTAKYTVYTTWVIPTTLQSTL